MDMSMRGDKKKKESKMTLKISDVHTKKTDLSFTKIGKTG